MAPKKAARAPKAEGECCRVEILEGKLKFARLPREHLPRTFVLGPAGLFSGIETDLRVYLQPRSRRVRLFPGFFMFLAVCSNLASAGELVFGVAHIFASFNDTFVHVTDLS